MKQPTEKNNNSTRIRDLILGVIVLVFLIVLLFLGVWFLGKWLYNIYESVSKWDAVVIVALITGMVSVIVAIVSRIIDHKNKRREYLAQKREAPYEAFIAMVYRIQENATNSNSYPKEEMITDIKHFSESLTLWGSKEVAEKWVKFRLNGEKTDSSENILVILEDILNQMRADMGVKKLKKGTLLSFFVNDVDDKKLNNR